MVQGSVLKSIDVGGYSFVFQSFSFKSSMISDSF